MALLYFTSHLARVIDSEAHKVGGDTVRAALNEIFEAHGQLKSYILDDQSRLRKHVNIFVDGRAIADRSGLGDRVGEDTEIYVMQALSGGNGGGDAHDEFTTGFDP